MNLCNAQICIDELLVGLRLVDNLSSSGDGWGVDLKVANFGHWKSSKEKVSNPGGKWSFLKLEMGENWLVFKF